MIAGENESLCLSNELFLEKKKEKKRMRDVSILFVFRICPVSGNTYIVMVAEIYETDL